VIPKAASEGHQRENLEATLFRLTVEEVETLTTTLDKYHLLFKDWPEYGVENIFA
jgi:diketogulonate reductase-like aldo/keto reductase